LKHSKLAGYVFFLYIPQTCDYISIGLKYSPASGWTSGKYIVHSIFKECCDIDILRAQYRLTLRQQLSWNWGYSVTTAFANS